MGYDITFHPIAADDIRQYIFDVIEQPELAEARAADMASNPEQQRKIERIYEQMGEWVAELSKGKCLPINETIAYATAQIAGILRPYWYARGAAISMLDDDTVLDLFVPLTKMADAPDCLCEASKFAHIGLNYSASGVITDLDQLERNLERLGLDNNNPPTLFTVFDRATLASLREAIAYCREHDLALIEAADVVVPIADETGTDADNFREAEQFEEPSSSSRQWFEPPCQEKPPAFEAFSASTEPLVNDTVEVRRLFGRNRIGTLVPLYLVPEIDRQKFLYTRFDAVLYAEGDIRPVRKRRLKVRERARSHREYLRRIFQHERSHYEQLAEEHPGTNIESARNGIGRIPDQILSSGLLVAKVGEWEIANKLFNRALLAADIIIRDKHDERDAHGYPGNRAEVIRTRWFANSLLDQPQDSEALVSACELHCQFAKQISPSQWHEYAQRDYIDFVLTGLVADRPDIARQMLKFPRHFDDQKELRQTYTEIANIGSSSARAHTLTERCMQLLDVIRHPHGGKFLSYQALTGVQLALVVDKYFAETPSWSDIRAVVDWFGK